MSSIEKMSIQGIRSFGPDDRERQIIHFFTPLTLILGPNGTGKTTIIESLKYMTTGNMPPGAGKDGAFIHDPKVAGEREIKAQIRLQFYDVRKQQCIVTRSLTATQNLRRVTMSTLECNLTRRDSDGNKTSVSSKCLEMNQEMVTLLGVSKPVLDYVIFCHQEESNWPLSEGKALKQKFDDIFASTRYVKALEVIRKVRTEQAANAKLYANDVKYLQQNRDKAVELRGDLDEAKVQYISAKDTVQSLQEKLEPIEQKLNLIRHKESDIHKLDTKIENLKSEVAVMEKSQQELRDSIEHEFTGTTEELREALAEFENKVQEREISLRQLETKLERAEQEAARLSKEKSKLLVEQGKLQQEAQRHKEDIKKRDNFVKKVSSDYDFEEISGSLSDSNIDKFRKLLESRAKACLEEAKERRALFDKEEGAVQEKIDEVRNHKAKFETELKMKADTMKGNQNQIRDINLQLSRVEASAERQSTVSQELKRADRQLEELEKSLNTDTLKTEISKLQREKGELDAKYKQLDMEIGRMHTESTARTQLEMFQKDRTTKEDQIRRLKAKNEDSIQHLLGHVPAIGLRRSMDEYISSQSRQVQKDTRLLQNLKTELTTLDVERKNLKEQIDKKEKEFKGYQERLYAESESQNFDEGITRLEGKVKSAQENKGLLMGATHVTRKYITKLRGDDPPCPLCHRPFDGNDEVEELIQELEERLRLIPDKLANVTSDLEQNQSKYDRMQQLKPIRANMIELEDMEIPNLKRREKSMTEQIETLRSQINEKEEDLEVNQSDEATAKSMQPDMMMMDRFQSELKDLDKKIASQSSKLSGAGSGRTMQQVSSEREEIQMNLEEVNRKLDHNRHKLSEHVDHVQRLRTDVNDLKTEKLQIDKHLQERNTLESTKGELQGTNQTLEREIRDTKEQLQPLQARIEKLLGEKEQITLKKEQKYEEDKDKFTKVKDKRKELDQLQKEIDRYVHDRCEERLESCTDKTREVVRKLDQTEENKEQLTANINKIRKDLSTQKVRERELSDNMILRRKQQEIEGKKADIRELDEKMGGLDVSNLSREKRTLNDQQDRLYIEKQRATGRQQELEGTMRQLKKQLDTEQYRNAEMEHKEKLVQLRTTEMATTDLDKYYKALDRTIMSYHNAKMAEINKIIRELWRNTYRGNDIETIEIRSDEDEGSGAAKKKRVYNYRVVMIKGDAALDMRGRCSAGQKVLASLIIRLALAETFCLNCGILCLDEPTTNLDRENIESLAYALVEIIKGRKKQKNFQLIVITHDEDFVELLGRSDYVDEFFKVRKDHLETHMKNLIFHFLPLAVGRPDLCTGIIGKSYEGVAVQYVREELLLWLTSCSPETQFSGYSQLVRAKVQDLHSR